MNAIVTRSILGKLSLDAIPDLTQVHPIPLESNPSSIQYGIRGEQKNQTLDTTDFDLGGGEMNSKANTI